jgi:hypothetical protein
VHATVVDLLGVDPSRSDLPLAGLVRGRSLLRPYSPREEPVSLLTTTTAVWEPDDARFGAMQGDRALMGAASGPWRCFDTRADPGERRELASDVCTELARAAEAAFAAQREGGSAR